MPTQQKHRHTHSPIMDTSPSGRLKKRMCRCVPGVCVKIIGLRRKYVGHELLVLFERIAKWEECARVLVRLLGHPSISFYWNGVTTGHGISSFLLLLFLYLLTPHHSSTK